MGIHFACHQCDKRLNVKRDLAGKRGVCPQCSARFRIPTDDAEKSTPVVTAQPKSAALHDASKTPQTDANHDSAASIDLLVDDPTSTWYVRPPTGGQYGPANSEILRSWIDEGRVAATSLLWREGWPQWRVASEALPVANHSVVVGNGGPASIVGTTEPVVSLEGRADVGVQRRDRTGRRILMIGVLLAIAIILIVALVIIANR